MKLHELTQAGVDSRGWGWSGRRWSIAADVSYLNIVNSNTRLLSAALSNNSKVLRVTRKAYESSLPSGRLWNENISTNQASI